MKKRVIQLIFILGLITPSVAQKNCIEYRCMIERVDNAIKRKDFKSAFKDLEAAAGYSDSKADEVAKFRKMLFDAIENEKQEAIKARDDAKKQTEIAKKALVQVEIEKQTAFAEKNKADSLFNIAEKQKLIAQKQTDSTKIALQKADFLFNIAEAQKKRAQAVLDKIYFYKDRFGMAYDKKEQNMALLIEK